jgi:diguanylate cyclase (GGDEF)-like protein
MIYTDQRLRRLMAWLDALDRRRTIILATALILLIVVADAMTGWRLRFTMFYIIPVWMATWKLGLRSGLAFAWAGAGIGSIINAAGFVPWPLADLPLWIWDVGARFVPLAIVAWLVDKLYQTILRERQLARSDALTGALNRRALLEEAMRALAQGQRLGLATGFLYVDLNGFKAVNDQHGHAVGDDLLVKFVAAAKSKLRRGDLVARVGGDEFVLLLVEASPEGVEGAASRVCAELRELVRAWEPPVSFCAGLCLVDPGGIQDPTVAMVAADKILYAAKRAQSETDWFRVIHLPPPLAARA